MVNGALTLWIMRRALVLTTESARHPFRQITPMHVFAPITDPTPETREPVTDLAFFLTSFTAGFIIFLGMII